MGIKFFYIVSKIWMCWKLCHKTPTDTGVILTRNNNCRADFARTQNKGRRKPKMPAAQHYPFRAESPRHPCPMTMEGTKESKTLLFVQHKQNSKIFPSVGNDCESTVNSVLGDLVRRWMHSYMSGEGKHTRFQQFNHLDFNFIAVPVYVLTQM
jgi:hypothetical protein